ncbi:MAG: hypothetical protein MJE63_16970 [Proteobacteria bacterium]|nr:hypothetical protein [Pseudomonadota bacterium]
MPKKKSPKPEFYRTFMKEGFFPNSNKITRFEESENYWIFKTGARIYKVKKKADVQSAVPLEEIFCNEISYQIQQHSPELDCQVFTIKQDNNEFAIDWDGSIAGKPLYYAVAMNQLSDRGFLSNIVSKGKLTESNLDKICAHLVSYHQKTKVSESKDDGSPDALTSKLENLYYQSKKYLGVTITKAMIDMTLRPLEKYLADNRKAFLKRMKQGYIRVVQGCFIPRKIHIAKDSVNVLGKTSDPLKDRYNDVSADIADLTMELQFAEQDKMSEYFIDKYRQLSGDKEFTTVLPAYQALRCLHLGLKHSIQTADLEGKDSEQVKQLAIKYYEQTIEVVRGL